MAVRTVTVTFTGLAPVAQLDRAGGFYPSGCGFDSCRGRHAASEGPPGPMSTLPLTHLLWDDRNPWIDPARPRTVANRGVRAWPWRGAAPGHAVTARVPVPPRWRAAGLPLAVALIA